MLTNTKNEIIDNIMSLLIQLTEHEDSIQPVKSSTSPVEMLTIKECADSVKGLSEHTVRQLVIQDKVACIRTGQGKRRKILVNKADLLKYLQA